MNDANTMKMLLGGRTKFTKPRKPRAKSIKVGASVIILGQEAIVIGRDEKYKSAWFIEIDGKASPYSFSRDMFKVLK